MPAVACNNGPFEDRTIIYSRYQPIRVQGLHLGVADGAICCRRVNARTLTARPWRCDAGVSVRCADTLPCDVDGDS